MGTGLTRRLGRLALAAAVLAVSATRASAGGGWSQSVLSLSPEEAKSIALGGALTSVRGDLEVVRYNPAALETFRYPQRFRLSPVLNPATLAVYAADRRGQPAWRAADASERLALVGRILPGVLVRWKALDFALDLGLDLCAPRFSERPTLRFGDWPSLHAHLAAVRLRLAKEVTVGASLLYAQQRDGESLQRGFGVSYGVLLQSHEGLRFGVAYVALPRVARRALRYRDHFASGTVNLGLSYTAFRRLLLSADVRNLSEEGKRPLREFHFGTELVVYRHLALRGGAFRDNERGETVLSGGFALLDRNRFVSPDRFLRRRSFLLEYGGRFYPAERQVIHVFSLLLRL